MIYELFSQRRKKAEQSGVVDVYQYDSASKKLRVQVQQILVEAIGPEYYITDYAFQSPRHNPGAWEFIKETLQREHGVHQLAQGNTHCGQVLTYLGAADLDGFMDVVELSLRYIERIISTKDEYNRNALGIKQSAEDAIEEVN